MTQILATDVPQWLENIIKRIQWQSLSSITKALVTGTVTMRCSTLPRKTGDSYCKNIETNAPDGILHAINIVDFKRMQPGDLQNFKNEIESAAKPFL